MPGARKFGGLPTLTPKGTLTLRKTLSPLYIPTNENSSLLGNGSSSRVLYSVRRMTCCLHRPIILCHSQCRMFLYNKRKGRYTPSLLLCSETTQSHELSAQTYHKRVMCSHFHSRAYEACHMPRARKFGGLPTPPPKKASSPFARRFRRPTSHRTGMYTSSQTRSPSHTIRPLRRMTCCLHRPMIRCHSQSRMFTYNK